MLQIRLFISNTQGTTIPPIMPKGIKNKISESKLEISLPPTKFATKITSIENTTAKNEQVMDTAAKCLLLCLFSLSLIDLYFA